MASSCNRFINRSSLASIRSIVRCNATDPPITGFTSSASPWPRPLLPSRPSSSATGRFFFSRSPSEIGNLKSPLPLKNTAVWSRMISTKSRVVRSLSWAKGKSGGRNSQGRITSFHRGGGSKRLHRNVDLKRNTPSMGIVERMEYDPNRTSRIALVRWIEGMPPLRLRKGRTVELVRPPHKNLEPTMTTICGRFSLSLFPRNSEQKEVYCSSPVPMEHYVTVGHTSVAQNH